MIVPRPQEEWMAEFDEVVRRYRLGLAHSAQPEALPLKEAVAAMGRLGFTPGEALRLLRPKQGR